MEVASQSEEQNRSTGQVADRIEQAKKQLENMIDLNPSVLLLVDRDGTILRGNIALLRLLGRNDFTGVLGHNLRDVLASEDSSFFDRLRVPGNDRTTCETQVRLPATGVLRDFRFTAVSPGEGSGSCVVIVNDITDEKQQAAEIAKSNKQEAVHALAGALMHNVNQSLTVIAVETHMMLAALEKGAPDLEAMRKDLGNIRDLVMQIANVLSQVARSTEYVTEAYPGGINIFDLNHRHT